MTGTPPKKMKWTLISQDKDVGITISIPYPSALSRSVLKDGEVIAYNKWIKANKAMKREAGYGPIE